MLRVVPLVFVIACARSGPASPVMVTPERSGTPVAPVAAGASDGSPVETLLPRDPGFADIATDPVHIWVGRAPDTVVDRVMIVGHADMACCQVISGLINASIVLGTVEGDAYHGFGDVRARGPQGVFALQEIVGVIEQSRNSEAECARQIIMHDFAVDEHSEYAAQIRGDADRGFALASELGRPLLLWNDHLSAAPQFAPVLVPAADGQLEVLQLELGLAEARLPRTLQAEPTSLRDGQREAQALVGRIRNLSALFAELRELTASGTDLLVGQQRVKVAGTGLTRMRAEIAGHNRCLLRARNLWRRTVRVQRDFQVSDDTPARTLTALDGFLADNGRVLHRLAGIGEDGDAAFTITRCEEATVAHDPKLRRAVRRFDARPTLARLEKEVERWRGLAARFTADLLGTVIDGGLRGINMGMEEGHEQAFDRWMAQHQLGMWHKLRAQATARGVALGTPDDPAGVLRASNLVLRVEKLGERVRITPHFVLTGPYYQVIDPRAGLVYYESAIAEHHLDRGEP